MALENLDVSDNSIQDLEGITVLKGLCFLKSLHVKGNPFLNLYSDPRKLIFVSFDSDTLELDGMSSKKSLSFY